MPAHFADRLVEAIQKKGAPLCVGLDPRWESLPASLRGADSPTNLDVAHAYGQFLTYLADVLSPIVPVVKIQVAFLEALGWPGTRLLQEVVPDLRRSGFVVIADAKRGDIASTADAYASAWLGEGAGSPWGEGGGPDAVTVSPYLGADSLDPFFAEAERRGKGVFVLVKTSNPGSGDLQDLVVEGRPLHERVAERVDAWGAKRVGAEGISLVGAVVGATHPGAAARLRQLMPRAVLLLPGIGAQGASPADVKACFLPGRRGALVSASRHVIYAWTRSPYKERYGEARWERACEEAARDLSAEIAAAL